MASEAPKRTRRPRFSRMETLTLVEEVESRAAVILGKLNGEVTVDKKNKAWEDIAMSVNAVSRFRRTPGELRKKFKDLRTHVKSKAVAEQRHAASTGGEPPVDITYNDAEVVVLRMLPPTLFAGLPISNIEDDPLRVSEPVPGPQPSTSNGDGVIRPSSAGVTGSAEASGFNAAIGESSSLVSVDVDEDPTFQIIKHTDDVPQCSQDPTHQLFRIEDPTQPSTFPKPFAALQPSAASQPYTALQPSLPPAAKQSCSRTPAGSQSELELIPQFLENQQEIRDLLHELVQVQHEQAQAQRELVEYQHQSAETQREYLNLLRQFMTHATEWFKANAKQ
uniref:Regulatory protein zeste n=1 Tax=Scylla olivacea TaxID=85551 RepID=A0A0P4WGE6_SCYOL